MCLFYIKTKHLLYKSLCLLDVAILVKIYVINKSANLTFFRFTIFSINFNFDFIRSVFILVTTHLQIIICWERQKTVVDVYKIYL